MGDAFVGQRGGGGLGLALPEVGEAGVGDAGIAAGGGEGGVERALAVAQQDHAAGLSGAAGAAQRGPVWAWPSQGLPALGLPVVSSWLCLAQVLLM